MAPRATWFCIDIECSGPVPHLYDMLSVGGACVVERDGSGYEIDGAFYVEIAPTAPRVDSGAMKVNRLDLARLKREGKPLGEALGDLSRWVAQETVPGSKPVFVGHNAPFDWSFISYSYHASEMANPFGYKALDTKALAAGVLGLHWFDTDKERLESLLKLPKPESERVHRADYDAWVQALILIGLLERAR